MKHLSVIVAAAAVVATAAACGGSSSDAASPASSPAAAAAASSGPATSAPANSAPTSAPATSRAPAAPAAVTIKDLAFAVPATVPAGATVEVKNDDGEAHTVTADSGGSFDTMVAGNATASFSAPTKPGRYPFHCNYHGNMHGVLVVT